MNNDELLKKVSSLEDRIKELESQKKENLSMFGRSYSQVGNSNSDFLIKTKGQVKIQWGAKFIDLIKDGKINVDSSFIFKVKDVKDIGVKDGIYVLNDNSVYLKSGGEPINLVGEMGNTFVSFLEQQETNSEQKYNALTNIGFIYKDLSQVNDSALKNGIVYIESEQKLYIIQDGELSSFAVDFPNPFTQQFIIAKTDNTKGSLLIKGEGINNSLAFETLYIYTKGGESFINPDGDLHIQAGGEDRIKVSFSQVEFLTEQVIGNMFKSSGANADSGFRLYLNNGESTLEIDNLILRKSSLKENSNEFIHPTYWYGKTNLITSASTEPNPENPEEIGYAISLKYKNEYEVGDYLYTYISIKVSKYYSKLILFPLKVRMVDTETGNDIFVELDTEHFDTKDLEITDQDEILASLSGKTVFFVGNPKEKSTLIKQGQNNIDIIQSSGIDDEQLIKSISVRIGKILELGLSIKNNGADEPYTSEIGVYSKDGLFLNAAYTSDYNLPQEDNSSRLASTEWVVLKLKEITDSIKELKEKVAEVETSVTSLEERVTALENTQTEEPT